MIDFLIFIILNLFGLFLIFALADRYWGAGFLGGIIPPRSVLVYENRPWWVRRIVLLTIIGGLASLLIVISSWIFMPYALDELLMPLGTLWAIILIAITINVVSEKTSGNGDKEAIQ